MSSTTPRLLLIGLVVAACGGGGPDDAGDGGDPSCHWDCFRSYFCLDGVVHQSAHYPIPCSEWRGECPHAPAGIDCERGCRDGVYAGRPEDVCEENVPKNEGDPCSAPGECSPGIPVSDGFGGTTELALECDLATGTCARVLVEECNGVDDDDDGSIDEECACVARIVADVVVGGAARDVAFAPDRIALLRDDGSVALVSPAGESLGTRAGGLHAHQIARVDTGFAVLRHDGLGLIDQVVVLGDDGSTRAVALTGAPTSRYLFFSPIGPDWLVAGGDGSVPVPLQVHDGITGARRAMGSLPLTTYGQLHAVALGGELAIVSGLSGAPIEAYATGASLAVRTLGAPSSERQGAIARPLVVDGRLHMIVRASFGTALATYDPSTGWSSHALGAIEAEHPPLIAADGADIVVSWVDRGTLRTTVLDPARARIGESSIAVGEVLGGVWSSGVAEGARVVIATDEGWRVIAPCDR